MTKYPFPTTATSGTFENWGYDTSANTVDYTWVVGGGTTVLDSLGIDDDDGGELALLDERVEEVCQMGRL